MVAYKGFTKSAELQDGWTSAVGTKVVKEGKQMSPRDSSVISMVICTLEGREPHKTRAKPIQFCSPIGSI